MKTAALNLIHKDNFDVFAYQLPFSQMFEAIQVLAAEIQNSNLRKPQKAALLEKAVNRMYDISNKAGQNRLTQKPEKCCTTWFTIIRPFLKPCMNSW